MRLPDFLTRAKRLAELRHVELMENDARLAHLLLEMRDRLDTLPAQLADAVLRTAVADVVARAAVRANAESQPLSIQAADKARVREQREREAMQR